MTPDSPSKPALTPAARLAAVVLAAASLPALAEEFASPAQQYQMALEAQSTGDYGRMLAMLRKAGQADYLPAQEMLGMALLAGPALYARDVPHDRCEATDWMRRAAAQGSTLGRAHAEFLGRLRHAAAGAQPCA